MSTTWRTLSGYIIFQLYFGEIHLFAPDFISKESFRPEIRVLRSIILVNNDNFQIKQFEFPGP